MINTIHTEKALIKFHGSNRLGGNAIADIMTYGKRAGEVAANK